MGHLRELKNNWLNFSGTIGRADFWWTQLWMVGLLLVAGLLVGLLGAVSQELAILVGIIGLFMLIIASMSLQTRRIRDAGYTPWIMLFHLLTFTAIIPWIFCVLPTNQGSKDPLF